MLAVPEVIVAWIAPAVVVALGIVLGFFARGWLHGRLVSWARRTRWEGDDIIVQATRWHLPFLVFLVGVYVGLHVAPVSDSFVERAEKVLAGLVTISITAMMVVIASGFIHLYARRTEFGPELEPAAQQVALITITGTGFLFFLGAVGVPATPLLLVLGIAALAGALAMRNALPDIFAWMSIAVSGQIRRGDRIRLESGEEGVVIEQNWRTTTLRSIHGDAVIVPNSRVAAGVVVKVRPKGLLNGDQRASTPFEFRSRLALPELTGLRAATLSELAEHMERVPLSVIYYHTLQFVEEHQYLTPTPPSHFARWVSETLDYKDLGEVLAVVDPCQCDSLEEFRQRLLALMKEYLSSHGDGRHAPQGQEFFFMKSRLFIFSTGQKAQTLRELADALKDVTLDSLYFHLFEARLRLGRPTNDFSAWIETHYGDSGLAGRINLLDPYTRTAEGLRNALVTLIEERI